MRENNPQRNVNFGVVKPAGADSYKMFGFSTSVGKLNKGGIKMETTIVKIEGNKIELIEKNEVVEYEIEEWVKPDFVKLGNADVTIKNGKIAFVSMKKAEKPVEKKTSTKSNKTGKWEDDMVTFEDLLTKAHELKKDFSIDTEMIVVDLEKKYALFKATITVHGEGYSEHFVGHGDATVENVTGEFIKPHFIRMAETRAIVRALRWYTNNGCAEEEK